MSKYETCSRDFGVSYHPWFDELSKLLKEKHVELNLDKSVLHDLYNDNVTVQEVYYICRAKTATSAGVTISWHDQYGRESVTFTNNESIRHFYKLVPYIREVMQVKPKKFH